MLTSKQLEIIERRFFKSSENLSDFPNGVYWLLIRGTNFNKGGTAHIIARNNDTPDPNDSFDYLMEEIESEIELGNSRSLGIGLKAAPRGDFLKTFTISTSSKKTGIGSLSSNNNDFHFIGTLIQQNERRYSELQERYYQDKINNLENQISDIANNQKSFFDKLGESLLDSNVLSTIITKVAGMRAGAGAGLTAPAIAGTKQPAPVAPPAPAEQLEHAQEQEQENWITAAKTFAGTLADSNQASALLNKIASFIEQHPDEATQRLTQMINLSSSIQQLQPITPAPINEDEFLNLFNRFSGLVDQPIQVLNALSIFKANFPEMANMALTAMIEKVK